MFRHQSPRFPSDQDSNHDASERHDQIRTDVVENIEKILEALEKTKVRLRANVNLELALELLFLTIREK